MIDSLYRWGEHEPVVAQRLPGRQRVDAEGRPQRGRFDDHQPPGRARRVLGRADRGDRAAVEAAELRGRGSGRSQARVGFVEQVVPGDAGFAGQRGRQPRPGAHEVALDAVLVVVEVLERQRDGGDTSRMPPRVQVVTPPVSVAHAGAPSQPRALCMKGGHVASGGVPTALPHASWCMSSTVYMPWSAASRTAFRILAT